MTYAKILLQMGIVDGVEWINSVDKESSVRLSESQIRATAEQQIPRNSGSE